MYWSRNILELRGLEFGVWKERWREAGGVEYEGVTVLNLGGSKRTSRQFVDNASAFCYLQQQLWRGRIVAGRTTVYAPKNRLVAFLECVIPFISDSLPLTFFSFFSLFRTVSVNHYICIPNTPCVTHPFFAPHNAYHRLSFTQVYIPPSFLYRLPVALFFFGFFSSPLFYIMNRITHCTITTHTGDYIILTSRLVLVATSALRTYGCPLFVLLLYQIFIDAIA